MNTGKLYFPQADVIYFDDFVLVYTNLSIIIINLTGIYAIYFCYDDTILIQDNPFLLDGLFIYLLNLIDAVLDFDLLQLHIDL